MNSTIGAVTLAFLLIPAFAAAEPPKGWFLAGSDPKSYQASTDEAVTREGRRSARLESIADSKGFGTLMQSFAAADYRGKRLRFAAWVKASGVKGWAGLWMRVDGADNKTLAFDNMVRRSIKGTRDWTRYEVVLDVAEAAEGVYFGILVDGAGKVWLSDVKLEPVDRSVAVTDMYQAQPPKAPVNLDFDR